MIEGLRSVPTRSPGGNSYCQSVDKVQSKAFESSQSCKVAHPG